MDTIETLQFTQQELRLIQISLNELIKKGGLNLADVKEIVPINAKLEEKLAADNGV